MFKVFTKKHKAIARLANQKRDAQEWGEASELYKQVVSIVGHNREGFRYLVQQGNCLKEAGKPEESLVSYQTAAKIFDDDSDLHLQMGHLFKLMGREIESRFEYQKAFHLDPKNDHARNEIERAGDLAIVRKSYSDGSVVEATHTIWLDVTDFVVYVKHNTSLSGIQRVIANLALYLKRAALPGYRVVPVIPEYDNYKIFSTSPRSFLDLVEIFDDENVSREKIDRLLNKVMDDRVQVLPRHNDVFMVAGAFWIYPHYDNIMHLRHIGMRFGLFIHDLIQIRMPEYVARDATEKFNIQLSDVLDISDFILANSEYVAEDVRKFLAEQKNYSLPVEAVVLPTELRSSDKEVVTRNQDILDFKNVDYVISVSTIEIRKNHKLLIKVWEKLREELGDKVPALVLVGKWGWEIDDFKLYVEEKGYIGDWLFIFNGISDVDMEFLYKHSMFSVYPSFAEGFGLPIGESLVYGIPCIASDTTSMPEVGGEFVRYIDPFDWEKSYPIIKQVIEDPDDLKKWREWIQRDFRPKTWQRFCDEFYSAILRHARNLYQEPPRANCPLPQGEFILGGTHDILNMARSGDRIITFRSARQRWWFPANSWGAWSQRRRAEIQFISDCAEGEIIDIFVRLHREASRENDPVVILNAGRGDHAYYLSEHPTVFKLSGKVTGGGVVRINLFGRGKFPSNKRFIGWSGIAYCLQGNEEMTLRTYSAIVQPGRLPSEVPYEATASVELI